MWRYFVRNRAGSRDAVVNKSFSDENFPMESCGVRNPMGSEKGPPRDDSCYRSRVGEVGSLANGVLGF